MPGKKLFAIDLIPVPRPQSSKKSMTPSSTVYGSRIVSPNCGKKHGLTQAQLAHKVGTTQAGISRLENPNYRYYSLKTLEKVAVALRARLKVELEENRHAA